MATLRDDRTMSEIRERISRLTPESTARWGKMSVGQMLCHCNDGCLMSLGRRPVGDTSNFLSRTVLKFLILNLLPMPKGAPTAGELDQMKNGTPPADFERDRDALLASLAEAAAMADDSPAIPHPFFGPMSRAQWGKLGYKHMDHHLRQFGV